ncbi:MurR/RpiR family transcriptional regulator [Tepidibacter hydrothermalis]|uniref:MurR/RpiR family transcriptional regulator n=1 Tax=Tepidibacter hydrothermalis TaxID=3036126 RepID=A0ABY8EF66_9FIRM|nr:MurR/RpiR family transcriptional regulator [Tepidibacter hydrothermalis]WFD09373.1 MurR/RpiR family transcriptional regulator [Tepidibacter hydrothermalis]
MNRKDEKKCLDIIKETYNSLNDTEKKVAKYILENPEDIIHFSITELAGSSTVSEATVSRFSRKLGFKGYQHLKINLAASFVEPMENIHEEISQDDDMYMIMLKILNSNKESLEKTYKLNDDKIILDAVNMITNASKIMFFGMGGSASLAEDAYHKFIRTGIPCFVHSDSHWQAMYASMADENSVMVVFSNSGSNKSLMDTIEIGRKNNVKIIAIVGNGKSPIARVADVVLTAYSKGSMFRSEAMESRISSLMLIDYIFVGVATRTQEKTLDILDKIRKGIATKRF